MIPKEPLPTCASKYKETNAWKKQNAYTVQVRANGFSSWEVNEVLLSGLRGRPTCVREYRDTVSSQPEHALSTSELSNQPNRLVRNPQKRGRRDRTLPWTPWKLKISILRNELYHRQPQQKVLCFYYLQNWLPSRSDLTLGTNWAMTATVLGRRIQKCRFYLLG